MMKMQNKIVFCLLGMFMLITSIAFAQGEDVKGSKDRSTILLEVSLNALSYSFATHRLEN